jgi:hypothetical protein
MSTTFECRNSFMHRACPNSAAAIRARGTTVSIAQAGTAKWYAVAVGRETSIFSSWAEVDPLVTGFFGARHKSFRHHYQALGWLDGITWGHDAAAAVSIVPAAGNLLDPPSRAPADEADALTREQAVASFMADGRDELSTKQRCAIEATFTASDTGSDSESSADTIDWSPPLIPDCSLRRRGGMRGSTPPSHLAFLSFFTFITPADAASPTAIFHHLVQSHRILLLSFLVVTLLLVLNNTARRVRRSTTASATVCGAPTPCPVHTAAAWVTRVAVIQPCMLFWPWCQSVWISSSAIMERHLSDIILFDWYVAEGRKRASDIYNACSLVLVAVAALVAADWPPGWCYAIPAAAVIVCVLGKRKSSGVLPGSAPVMVVQAVMLVLYYSNLVTRSAAILPLPALLVYSVAAWASARRMTPVAAGVGSLMVLILFGLLPLVTEIPGAIVDVPEFPPIVPVPPVPYRPDY